MRNIYRVVAIEKVTGKREYVDVYDFKKDAVEAIKNKEVYGMTPEDYETHTFKVEKDIW